MPHTVPKRPMNGAVLPIDASSTWPNCSCVSTACSASRSRRVSCESMWPWASSVLAFGLAVAASSSGASTCSRSNAASWSRPDATLAALQNADRARDVDTHAAQQPAFPEDHHPGAHRHHEQQRRDAAGDEVTLLPE